MTITGKIWECSKCKHVHYGKSAPEECPKCGAIKEDFIELPEEIVEEREKEEFEDIMEEI